MTAYRLPLSFFCCTMIFPELKSLHSPDLERPALPSNPSDCVVFIEASIGARGEEDSEIFGLTVITPLALQRTPLPRWGSGLYLTERFSWEEVDRALERLLAASSRPTWAEVALCLSKNTDWEFNSYR